MKMARKLIDLILSVVLLWMLEAYNVQAERSFTIDHRRNCFLKDGQPFRYVSGTVHYFRVPRPYWAESLRKTRLAGFNALQTYVEWSRHEPEEGQYSFSGDDDLVTFIKMAAEADLLVILRPGPFIDADRDLGGYPYWLLKVNKTMPFRTLEPSYRKYNDRWMEKLLSMMKPLLYENGGPIIAVQVENEYGSYGCDFAYTAYMRDLTRRYLGNNVVLFTIDGPGDSFLQCGKIYDVLATVDFGPGRDVKDAFYRQRLHQGTGPLVNPEFYSGWFDHWGCPHSDDMLQALLHTMGEMLALNASFNMYSSLGGTSFGFTAGSNINDRFQPDTTSYDFNAPLSEAGDPTPKFFAIRELIGKYLPLPPGPLPTPKPKMGLEPITLHKVSHVLDLLPTLNSPIRSVKPLSFEDLGQAYGYVVYITRIKVVPPDPVILNVPGLRDRGYVFVNGSLKGILSREQEIYSMPILIRKWDVLSILVENQGRVCFGKGILDHKGIIENVTVASEVLTDWEMYPLPLGDTSFVTHLERLVDQSSNSALRWHDSEKVPAFYGGSFILPNVTGLPMDTFLRLDGWHKGIAILNGFNLGRYWPIVGPQVTLYVPGFLFHAYPSPNVLLVLEQEHAPCSTADHPSDGNCQVAFVKQHVLNGTTPFTCRKKRENAVQLDNMAVWNDV